MIAPRHLLAVLLGALLALGPAGKAFAQTAQGPDFDVDPVRTAYEYGRYQDALEKARARIDRGGLTPEQLVSLQKYAGLAAFNLGRSDDAARHLTALLQLDPDYTLDPFAVSPAAITLFEKLKKDLDPQLELIRQQKRLEAERQRREAEDRARRQREDEERRRRLEELSRRVTVHTVEKHSFLVNFVPFGAGQFQQDRTATGVVLAAGEGAFALTSIIAYLAYAGLQEPQTLTVDTVGGPKKITRWGIPPNRVNEATTWKIVKYASAGAFYATYGYGVVDAIIHHQDETVTTTTEAPPVEPQRVIPLRAPPSGPDSPPPPKPEQKPGKIPPLLGPSVTGSAALDSLSPHPFIYPTPGGLGAGLTLQF